MDEDLDLKKLVRAKLYLTLPLDTVPFSEAITDSPAHVSPPVHTTDIV